MSMEAVTLHAHFDGKQIVLDDPYELQPDARLLVTVIHVPPAERNRWLKLSSQGLAAAYGDEEPDYPLTLVKEPNPTYETG